MYLSPRAAQLRNLSIAFFNGLITLIILLIAPMGLLGVIMNTALVAVSSFVVATTVDRLVLYLLNDDRTRAYFEKGNTRPLTSPTNQLPTGDRRTDSSER